MRHAYFAVILTGILLSGCVDPREEFGKTWYLDGAGNWGFGVADVADGLMAAGYRGKVDAFLWTTSFNPAIDQINRVGAAFRAQGLASTIDDYLDRYPNNEVNIIALSAGTGVAMWAVEDLRPPHTIHNLILLGSSLSYDYDIRKAAKNITGKIYVYYSRHDSILSGPVKALGTIDGKPNYNSAGLIGLRPPHGPADKVVNIGWSRKYIPYGWAGAHTDATSRRFVEAIISKHIITPQSPVAQPTTSAPAIARRDDS